MGIVALTKLSCHIRFTFARWTMLSQVTLIKTPSLDLILFTLVPTYHWRGWKPKTSHKDWPAKKVTIFNTIVHLVKTSENILFFACILPDYVADEITKEFWKNSHFENMRVDFPLRCQNSLWWNSLEIMHFQT